MLLHDKLKPYRTDPGLAITATAATALAESGLPVRTGPRYDCQEVYPATLAATQVPRYLSQLKSRAYPRPLAENEILLTADTVVILNGEVLGKPEDREDAIRMLERLSGPPSHGGHGRHAPHGSPPPEFLRTQQRLVPGSDPRGDRLLRGQLPSAGQGRQLRHSGVDRLCRHRSASTARSSTSWGCRSNASIPNSINSFNQ